LLDHQNNYVECLSVMTMNAAKKMLQKV